MCKTILISRIIETGDHGQCLLLHFCNEISGIYVCSTCTRDSISNTSVIYEKEAWRFVEALTMLCLHKFGKSYVLLSSKSACKIIAAAMQQWFGLTYFKVKLRSSRSNFLQFYLVCYQYRLELFFGGVEIDRYPSIKCSLLYPTSESFKSSFSQCLLLRLWSKNWSNKSDCSNKSIRRRLVSSALSGWFLIGLTPVKVFAMSISLSSQSHSSSCSLQPLIKNVILSSDILCRRCFVWYGLSSTYSS